MTKQKLNNYLNGVVILTFKDGSTTKGRIRLIGKTYIIGKDIEVKTTNVKKIEKADYGCSFKILKREKIESHITKETCISTQKNGMFISYVVRYVSLQGKKIDLVKRFKTLEDAQAFKSVCEKNINEIKFATEKVDSILKETNFIDYPDNLLKDIGIVPEDYENYYNEIVPGFDDAFSKICSDTLAKREIDFLSLRYKNKMTLEEVAKKNGITRERVRQITNKALKKLIHSRAKSILTEGIHKYELINAKEREELYAKLKEEMTYDLALEIIKKHDDECGISVGKTSIDELSLSVRTWHCLRRSEINDVNELTSKTEEDLMKIKSFGKKCLMEIKFKLADMGLTLRKGE